MTLDLLNLLQQIDPDKSFGDEELTRLEKTRHEQTRLEKRKLRIADCGKWSNWYNPHSGKQTGFVFRCGLFRHCESCLEKRADEEYSFMKQAALDKRMVVVFTDAKTATNLLRKADDKSQYVRYPQEDGFDMLVLDETLGIEGRPIDLSWVMAQNWTTLTATPEGRNKSGTLHLPPSDDDPEDFTIINTQQFITSADRGTTLNAMTAAELETADLDPQTPDEVVQALRRRVKATTSKLRQAGYTVNVYSKKLKLVHALVDWQGRKARLRQIKRFNTENPTCAESRQIAPIDRDVGIPVQIAPISALVSQ